MPSIRLSRAGQHGLHYLPTSAIWATTIVIALIAAITNFVMVWIDVKLVNWKFDSVQSMMTDNGFGMGALTLLGWAVLLSGISTSMVCLIAPACAGSGLPEIKGYLNGNDIPGMFEMRNFFVRVLGIVTSTAAGLPAGREGPMVCIGAFIGYRVVDLLRQITWLRTFFNLDIPRKDEEWFADVRRIGATLGAAAGVAVAFNAPLGAILYMLEEATVTAWAPETTFRCLMCTGCGALFTRGLLNWSGSDFNRLVIFEASDTAAGISWDWIDVPFFIILAAFTGACSGGFTQVLIFVWSTRKKIDTKLQRFQPYVKMVGAVCFAILVSIVIVVVPLLFDCVDDPAPAAGHRRLGGGATLVFVQYDCPSGQHNNVATLLLNPGEAAVKHLVSRGGGPLGCGVLAVAVLVYGVLAMGMPGLAVPMGNFIPAMVIGSMFGRFLGEALDGIDSLHGEVAHAGVYAMVGSAAMLGGFTHMTIAIVCLLTEAGHDIGLVPPLMLSIFVAHVFSHKLNHVGYDEKLILMKGVPYLELELPEVLDEPKATAGVTCWDVPKESILCTSNSSNGKVHQFSKEELKAVLGSSEVLNNFPVLADDGTCLGVCDRSRLEGELALTGDGNNVDVRTIMNSAPFRLLEDMAASRFYALFSKGITSFACVVDKQGKFRGMLSKSSIIAVINNGLGSKCAAEHEDGEKSAWEHSTPHAHHIPGWLIWAITFSIALCVAITNYCMVWVDVKLVMFKFETVQKVMTSSGAGAGFGALLGISMLFAATATCLVCFGAPICAGSGLPEAKGYLNGNPIPHMFDIRTFIVRVLGIVFSTAAGYPAGREGPMVCIGAWIGEKVTQVMVLPQVKKWVKMDASSDHFSVAALMVDEEMFHEAKRVGAALGGAAGVAVAFNAPIGGILYMFEEVGVTSWAPELTFRALVIAAVGSMASRALLNATDADFHQLVIFEDTAQVGVSWEFIDVPFFAILAAIVGSCAAGFTRVLVFVWKLRRKMHSKVAHLQPYPKIVECLLYVALCSACYSLLPMAFDCVSEGAGASSSSAGSSASHASAGHGSVGGAGGRRLGGGASLLWFQYDCPEGQHNPLASLLLNSGESGVKHLVSRAPYLHEIGPLVVAAVVYTMLAMGMPGLAVPMGNFIPAMVIGSLLGRIMGEGLNSIDSLHGEVASPGVYAIVGAAAMLGGFTHMSIAIVCLLTEAGHDITLISPLMLSIFVAHFFSKIGNHHGYDEVLIVLKNVPLLDAEVPHELEDHDITTCQLCHPLPAEAILTPGVTGTQVRKALASIDSPVYPVVSEKCGNVVGLVTACRLRTLAGKAAVASEDEGAELLQTGIHTEDICEEDEELDLGDIFKARCTQTKTPSSPTGEESLCFGATATGEELFDLRRVMDPIPFEIIQDMPASASYTLFASAIVHNACVISREGQLCGVLSRSNFMIDHIKKMDVGAHKEAMEPMSPTSPTGSQDIDLRYTAAQPSAGSQPEAPRISVASQPAAAAEVVPESPSAALEKPPLPEETGGYEEPKEEAADVQLPGLVLEMEGPGAAPSTSDADETAIPVA